LDINNKDAGDVKVVGLDGNLDTNTSPAAQTHLDELINNGGSKVLIDLEKLNYISSAGLRVMLATAKKLRAAGGDLRLCSLNQNVQDVFEISGFSSILSVHGSEVEALDGF
jgi:anti-sigma B factor antagonist